MAQTVINHRRENITELRREVNLLRSFVIGMIKKDKEGKYHQKFVKEVLQALREKTGYAFEDKKSFLNCLGKFVNTDTIKLLLVGHRKDIYQKF